MDILKQLAELFIESIPTIIILLLFYVLLKYTFFNPLLRVMDERKARTEGARRAADEAQAAAREKMQAYEEALRKARAAVLAEQDTVRRGILDERAAQAKDARARAIAQVQAEKDAIAKDVATARGTLEASVPALAAEMVRRLIVVRPGNNSGSSPLQGSSGGAR